MSESAVALVNSLAVAVYFLCAPLASAVINRYGFRTCVMAGSVLCSTALASTYFAPTYVSICVFYGATAGLGYCLVNMASILVVGFYFERLRAMALALTATGSSIGIMVMFPVNSYIVELAGWRVLTLLQSGMFGIIFFLGMTFRPLLSLTVTKTMEETGDIAVFMPSLANIDKVSLGTLKSGSTVAERIFSTISSTSFPTVTQMMQKSVDTISTNSQAPAGPSKAPLVASRSKMTITATNPHGGISQIQLKRVQSSVSKASENLRKLSEDVENKRTEIPFHIKEHKSGESAKKLYEIVDNDVSEISQEQVIDENSQKKSEIMTMEIQETETEPRHLSCWNRLCCWEEHVAESRPMYRDDAFYEGRMKELPAYKRSKQTSSTLRTGLEYQLEVTRVAAVSDLREHRGICTTAARRVLATMMDPKLLAKKSFLCLCLWAFLTYLGYLVPYIFLKQRNLSFGMDPKHCSLFVSAIGLSNAVGRLVLGALAWKLDTLKLFRSSVIIAGVGTMLSAVSHHVYYQYGYCCVYGFCVASIACLRSTVLVELYGLDRLTNATGMMLLFQGMGSFVGTPIASLLKTKFGYEVTFYVAGGFLTLSGVCLLPVKTLARQEDERKV